MTLKQVIIDFMKGCTGGTAALKQIYEAIDRSDYQSVSSTVHDSARAVIYRNTADFKRICKGVYMLTGEKAAALLINGDGRQLDEIEDSSVDCIITDHPWDNNSFFSKPGNQKSFSDYDTFLYQQSDFNAKARVLKPGAFLVEFLPVESPGNFEYLYEIKKMAKKAGLNYYASCIWRNAPEGTVNTGRTTKGVQQIVFFSKGKPRKLSRQGVNAYQTKEILKYEVEMLLPKSRKHHQAEKPVELYEYLIRNLTDEKDICLDQFGGSCNMLRAALNLDRFAIVYELAAQYVRNAVERFSMTPLVEEEAVNDTVDKAPGKKTPKGMSVYHQMSLFELCQ